MLLRCLKVTNFRNLKTINIELGNRLNVFFGDNGSGKTSLLESVHTLSSSRSFRSRKHKTIINHSADHYTLYSLLADDVSTSTIGVQRDISGSSLFRVNQNTVQSSSVLAELLPVRVINAHSFLILDGAPQERRKLLDWLVFHVEHDFLNLWKSYEKCIKQRNTLLRHDKIDQLELSSWQSRLAALAPQMDAKRVKVFKLLKSEFNDLIADVDELPEGIELQYRRGWDKETDYTDYLLQHQLRDQQLGYTRQGPHRADIRVTVDGRLAADVLSRGQQKMVVCALLLSQGRVFTNVLNKQSVYLVDDMAAELDESFRRRLCSWLNQLGCQVFITGVDKDSILSVWPKSEVNTVRVFHVEHGSVNPCEDD